MGQLTSRIVPGAVSRIVLHPAPAGSRAVFLVEVRNARERRQLHELFRTVAELADVAPLADGEITAYAIQSGGDLSLFSKIEALLKSQFCFAIVEFSFTPATYRVVTSLCEETDSRLLPVPQCNICGAHDPFPTSVSLRDDADRELVKGDYCARCVARYAEASVADFVERLLAADRRDLPVVRAARRTRWRPPEQAVPASGEIRLFAAAS